MADCSTTIPHPAREIAAGPDPIEDIDRAIHELKNQTSTLYFATLGVIEFTAGSCPNPGDFDGILAHCRAAWQNADRLATAWEALPPIGGQSHPGIVDNVAYEAWLEWYQAGKAAQDLAEATPEPADASERLDLYYGVQGAVAKRLGGTSPVAIAARLHVTLEQSGGYTSEDGREHWQAAAERILDDLSPMLPAEMQEALRTPYRFIALPKGVAGGAQ